MLVCVIWVTKRKNQAMKQHTLYHIGIIQIRIHAIKHVHSKNALSEIQVI